MLKTCPFCGSEARASVQGGDSEVNGYNFNAIIRCTNCKASVGVRSKEDKNGWCIESSGITKERAIKAWNRRV